MFQGVGVKWAHKFLQVFFFASCQKLEGLWFGLKVLAVARIPLGVLCVRITVYDFGTSGFIKAKH